VFSTVTDGQSRNGVTVEFFNNFHYEGKPVRTNSSQYQSILGQRCSLPRAGGQSVRSPLVGPDHGERKREYTLRAAGGFGRLMIDGRQFGVRGAATPQFVTLEAGKAICGRRRNGGSLRRMNVELQWAMRAATEALPQPGRPMWVLFLGPFLPRLRRGRDAVQ